MNYSWFWAISCRKVFWHLVGANSIETALWIGNLWTGWSVSYKFFQIGYLSPFQLLYYLCRLIVTLLVLVNFCPVLSKFWWNSFAFDQQYLNIGLKTQNVEKLSLDLIFIDNFCQNTKSFSKQNSILRFHSKPTEFTQDRIEIDKNFQCILGLPRLSSFCLPGAHNLL